VRERMSFEYVTRKLGLPEQQVTLTADPAFLLSPTEASWREHFGFDRRSPLVALSTSQAICNWMGSDYANHFRIWCEVIGWLRHELDANLVLIPHVQELSTKNDDRILATALMRHFKFDRHLQIAGGDFSASDFKGIISQCDLVVAERMHAAIAGLSSTVPTVVIGYSVKGEGILTDLLGTDTVRRSVLIPLKEFLDGKTPRQRIASAWKDRVEIQALIAEQLPETKRRAAASFDIVASRLQAARQECNR
jgi:colanic acid/amylovoran biosynthesis protein